MPASSWRQQKNNSTVLQSESQKVQSSADLDFKVNSPNDLVSESVVEAERMGDTLKHLKQPGQKHAKPYSREQIYANIETMKQSVPLN